MDKEMEAFLVACAIYVAGYFIGRIHEQSYWAGQWRRGELQRNDLPGKPAQTIRKPRWKR